MAGANRRYMTTRKLGSLSEIPQAETGSAALLNNVNGALAGSQLGGDQNGFFRGPVPWTEGARLAALQPIAGTLTARARL